MEIIAVFFVALIVFALFMSLPIFLVYNWIKGFKEEKQRQGTLKNKLIDDNSIKEAVKNTAIYIFHHPKIL